MLLKCLTQIIYMLYFTLKNPVFITHFIDLWVCSVCHRPVTTATKTTLVYQSLSGDKCPD